MSKLNSKNPCPCGSGKRYKRCCKNRRFCYLDETGNTGLNLFDDQQEFFIQGCAMSRTDLEGPAFSELKNIIAETGKAELHANELGLKGLSPISAKLVSFIEKHDVQFIFSVVEKRYYLAIGLFHLFYDTGLNPAASPMVFGSKLLRMALAVNFSQLVTEKNLRDFWNSTQTRDVDLFVHLLSEIREALRSSALDQRSKELLDDALTFSISEPKDIFDSMRFDRGVSANLSAFGMTINLINRRYGRENIKIEKLVHDSQDEFGPFLKKTFPRFRQKSIPSSPLSFITQVDRVNVIEPTELVLIDSILSGGLQIVDVGLWIFKRLITGQELNLIDPLVEVILERHYYDGVIFSHHQEFVAEGIKEVSSMNQGAKQIEKGKILLKELEERRWKRSK